jgi:hypothetical protein
MNPLMNSDQVCDYLQISYRRFLQYTQEDSTFPARMIGGKWKVDADELKKWVMTQTNDQVAEEKPAIKKRGRPPKKLTHSRGNYQVNMPGINC